jgi:uncharacterized protein YjbI with pentapeptide repeats
LSDVNFTLAQLPAANFDGADIPEDMQEFGGPGTRFWSSCLTNARFRNADLSGVDFAPRPGSFWAPAFGRNLDFTQAVIRGRALAGAIFKQSVLATAVIEGGLPDRWTRTGDSSKELPTENGECIDAIVTVDDLIS